MGEIATASSTLDQTRQRRTNRTAALLGFLAIATQRFGFGGDGEGPGVQAATIVLLFSVAWTIFVFRAKLLAASAVLYCAITASVCVSAILAFSERATATMPSLLLMLATYSVVLVAGAGVVHGLGNHFFRGAIIAIGVGAVLAVFQEVLQRLGRGFFDPLTVFPQQFLVGGYNTYWDLRYQGGVGLFKPNGIIFLEPALLSLYTSIGLVYVLTRLTGKQGLRDRRSNIFLLVAMAGGFAVSASASGVAGVRLVAWCQFLRGSRRR
ncbi:hypothetical protein [Microbacterium lacus]|uniref:hypothetical protein n=1 Tax=Microbacterium lacus TaxID=415217 RepID=UPI0018E250BE|nr:hypothetical protein [Microbacterium lacus]